MKTKINTARAAGFTYLVVITTGLFSLAYIPGKLIDWNHPQVSFEKLVAARALFRAGIYSSVICYLAFALLPLLLYQLLKSVNEFQARLMVILALLSVPFSFANLQHLYAALTLTGNAPLLQTESPDSLQKSLMLVLYQYNDGILLATVFWGLWLLPFGWLMHQSGFAPKVLGILLILGGLGHFINFSGNTLFENYSTGSIKKIAGFLPALAEISTCIWLLLFGLKIPANEK